MSANVETMAYVKFEERDVPWHGIGTPVNHAMSSAEALSLSSSDWLVKSLPMFVEINGKMVQVPNVFANTRSSDNSVLGTVSGKYKIVQNHEAFSFTDALLGEGVKYETAGVLDHGKRVWILARLPDSEILGDKYENYLVFTNSHDGKGSIRIACTPVRVVCQNTLNMALNGAKRSWSTKHMGDMNSKMAEAHRTLELATKYSTKLEEKAKELVQVKISMLQFNSFVDQLIPLPEVATKRQKATVMALRDDLNTRYMEAPDLGNIRGTAWGVFNAVSDFATHKKPQRSSDTFQENVFASVIDGNKIMDTATTLLSTF